MITVIVDVVSLRRTYVRLRCFLQANLAWRGALPVPVACALRVDEASLRQDSRHVHEGPRPPLHRAAHIHVQHLGREMSADWPL